VENTSDCTVTALHHLANCHAKNAGILFFVLYSIFNDDLLPNVIVSTTLNQENPQMTALSSQAGF